MQWHLLTVFEYKESMGRSVGTWIGQCSCGIANFISFARIRHGVWHARIGKCMVGMALFIIWLMLTKRLPMQGQIDVTQADPQQE